MNKNKCKNLKGVFLNAIDAYHADKKAVFTPLVSHQDNLQEYIGTIKSGKVVYFAFISEDVEGRNIEYLNLSPFIKKAKIFFDLGGIVFVILCHCGRTYRIPYFILESSACETCIKELAVDAFEFESNDKLMNFFQKDVYECTIAGQKCTLL